MNWPLVAVICFGGFAVAWLSINQINHTARVDQLDDDERRHHDALTKRVEDAESRMGNAEAWIRELIGERNRPGLPEPADFPVRVVHVDAPDPEPATVPIRVPDAAPETVPDLKAASKVAPLASGIVADWELARDRILAEADAEIRAVTRRGGMSA